ncbi:MAG: PilW family protein [Planctomycetota bacterium]|jgi:prepilin-type N-terminal cleavage/methylation domain-containing protein
MNDMSIILYKADDRGYAERENGFSLAEMLVALTIGAMILVAVLTIYNRTETAAAAIISKIDSSRLPAEILQRIAEDLDRVSFSTNTKITAENKLSGLYPAAKLEILKSIYNDKNKKITFERIVWVASSEADGDGMVLYRSHSGLAGEDKLLDAKKEDWQRELFVPICNGLTYFKIQIPQPEGKEPLERWTSDKLPNGVLVTISFEAPHKTLSGVFEVADEDKMNRMIAIDRTRKINFNFLKKVVEQERNEAPSILNREEKDEPQQL